jgi:predicted DNA-binding transcriptional regulator YafY
VSFRYTDGTGSETERTVTPLGLYFWGRDWLLAAYCFLRRDYRSFRVDRIRELAQLEADPGRFAGLAELPTLAGYVRTQEARHAAEIAACRVGRPPGSE